MQESIGLIVYANQEHLILQHHCFFDPLLPTSKLWFVLKAPKSSLYPPHSLEIFVGYLRVSCKSINPDDVESKETNLLNKVPSIILFQVSMQFYCGHSKINSNLRINLITQTNLVGLTRLASQKDVLENWTPSLLLWETLHNTFLRVLLLPKSESLFELYWLSTPPLRLPPSSHLITNPRTIPLTTLFSSPSLRTAHTNQHSSPRCFSKTSSAYPKISTTIQSTTLFRPTARPSIHTTTLSRPSSLTPDSSNKAQPHFIPLMTATQFSPGKNLRQICKRILSITYLSPFQMVSPRHTLASDFVDSFSLVRTSAFSSSLVTLPVISPEPSAFSVSPGIVPSIPIVPSPSPISSQHEAFVRDALAMARSHMESGYCLFQSVSSTNLPCLQLTPEFSRNPTEVMFSSASEMTSHPHSDFALPVSSEEARLPLGVYENLVAAIYEHSPSRNMLPRTTDVGSPLHRHYADMLSNSSSDPTPSISSKGNRFRYGTPQTDLGISPRVGHASPSSSKVFLYSLQVSAIRAATVDRQFISSDSAADTVDRQFVLGESAGFVKGSGEPGFVKESGQSGSSGYGYAEASRKGVAATVDRQFISRDSAADTVDR